jgi:hypothetical protein
MYFPSDTKNLSAKIQAPFVLAQIRALRASLFKKMPEAQAALAIADKVEQSHNLQRTDLFVPASETWCAILEPFATSTLPGTLHEIGFQIFPQYVSILGIPLANVKTAMDLKAPADVVRTICTAYSTCVVGRDAGTLTPKVTGSVITVTDDTIIPCQLQIGVLIGGGASTGLFRASTLTKKRCRGKGDPVCSYEFAF